METRVRPRVELLEGRALMSAGAADPTFGGTGYVQTMVGTAGGRSSAVAVQPDLKVIDLGSANNNGPSSTALARFNADGSLDSSFGAAGKVNFSFVGPNSAMDSPDALAIQPGGKIVVVGTSMMLPSGVSTLDVARLNTNGTLDTTFGGGTGKVVVAQPSGKSITPWSVLIQGDGKILVEGWQASGNALALLRYNPNGSPDATFGTNGMVINPAFIAGGNINTVHPGDVAIDAAGRIDVAGFVGGLIPTSRMAVIRYNPNGTPDATFGSGGVASAVAPGFTWNQGHTLALQSGGKIVVAGFGGTPDPNASQRPLVLARFNTDGSLDDGSARDGTPGDQFGNAGFFVESRVSATYGASVVVEGDDKIVALAHLPVSNVNNVQMALTRVLADGSASDPTFGQNGVAVVNFPTISSSRPVQLVDAPDGKFVVTGRVTATNGLSSGLNAFRFLGDTTASRSFATAVNTSVASAGSSTLIPLAPDDPSVFPGPIWAKRRRVS